MKICLKFIAVTFIWLSIAMTCDYDDSMQIRIDGIESFNINNEGKSPFVTDSAVKREAFLIGIKWITKDRYEDSYNTKLINIKQKRIFCNTDFDENHPAGSDVSNYFKKARYTPYEIDEGFVLTTIPQPDIYSFKIVFICNDDIIFEYDTLPVNLY